MSTTVEDARQLALTLADVTEEPHHHFGSWRVRGRIFVTIPPGGELLHVFLPPEQREHALAMDPGFLEPLPWGQKILGVRVHLGRADPDTVRQLVQQAYAHKAAAAPARRRTSKPR